MTKREQKASWRVHDLYRTFPDKARLFFLARLSSRYLRTPLPPAAEEIIVGYEASWPESYKKVH